MRQRSGRSFIKGNIDCFYSLDCTLCAHVFTRTCTWTVVNTFELSAHIQSVFPFWKAAFTDMLEATHTNTSHTADSILRPAGLPPARVTFATWIGTESGLTHASCRSSNKMKKKTAQGCRHLSSVVLLCCGLGCVWNSGRDEPCTTQTCFNLLKVGLRRVHAQSLRPDQDFSDLSSGGIHKTNRHYEGLYYSMCSLSLSE